MTTLVISTIAGEPEVPARMGSASYSYYYVYQAFAPLLQRWGALTSAVRPQQRLDDIIRSVPQPAIHLGFLPLDAFHRTSLAPNVAFPFWDFPDLYNDWAAVANKLDLILTSSEFTRDTFVRAGVRTPISVVPVPVRPEYLDVPIHEAARRVVIDCKCYELTPVRSAGPRASNAKRMYQRYVAPSLSRRSADALSTAAHALSAMRGEWHAMRAVDCAASARLELSGIVYTTILNPFDQRKNWADLLTAYLLALADCDDATLVIKLAVPADRAAWGVNTIVSFYRRAALAHRCKVVLVSDYLSSEQMLELVRGTSYYLNSSRAEGACLPLQDFLAAARPAIAPRHTAIADYFTDGAGFVVESHPEPTSWPQDREGRCMTFWYRIVWTSLRDAIRESYDVAKSRRSQYETLAMNARASMVTRAGTEAVWTRLSTALESVHNAV